MRRKPREMKRASEQGEDEERLRERPRRVSEGHGCCWSSSRQCDKGGASVSWASFQDCSTEDTFDNGPEHSPDEFCIKNHAREKIIELHIRIDLQEGDQAMRSWKDSRW